jgi:hypothetical protein
MLSIQWKRYSAILFLVLTCITTTWNSDSNADEMSLGPTNKNDKSKPVKKPQIPSDNFEWNGTFRVPGEGKPVITDLTIRGMWQDGYFNVYMQQGFKGGEVWVENLIYQNHFYTITHEWPGGVKVPGCYGSLNEISVDHLNGILASSQLVGLERIDGTPMNHFRVSCLSTTYFIIPLNIFSDIYVRPGRSHPFERWLQFGDGVGLSKQHDEWFFFEEHNTHPKEFGLPLQCVEQPIPVLQQPCSNLSTGVAPV